MAVDIHTKKPVKASGVLAQRDTLTRELAAAHQSEHDERRNVARHQSAQAAFNDTRMKLYGDKARGRLEGLEELNEAEHGWAEAKRQGAAAKDQQEAARRAITAVEMERATLYQTHLAVFAAEAEQHTQQAAKVLAELQAPYQAAWAAWHRAMQAWLPLQPAITVAVITADNDDGMWRDRTQTHLAARVPELPLPEPSFLSGIPAARPPAMQPVAPGGENAA